MKDYTTDNPEFADSIRILDPDDEGHADNVNVTTKQLLQNTLVLHKKLVDKISEVIEMFKTRLINNLLASEAGKGALDAYQGKLLKDLYDSLNAEVTGLKLADFGTPTASVDNNTGMPSVEVTASGPNTAKVFNFVFKNLKGAKGDKGEKGNDGINGTNGTNGTNGASAGFGTPTASVDANTGTPSVQVTASGPNTAKVFNFVFKNLKGAKGDKGEKGNDGINGTNGTNGTNGASAGFGTPTASVDANTGTPSVQVTASGPNTAKIFNFVFKNLKGATGPKGDTPSLINNLLATAAGYALDARQGKALDDKITALNGKLTIKTVSVNTIFSSTYSSATKYALYHRNDFEVQLEIRVYNFSITADRAGTIATLPAEARPSGNRMILGAAYMNNVLQPAMFLVASNGAITQSMSSSASVTFTQFMIIGSYLR